MNRVFAQRIHVRAIVSGRRTARTTDESARQL